MKSVLGRVTESGRISLPAEFRRQVGLEHGGAVVVELAGQEIRIRTIDETVARAQALTRRILGDKREGSVASFLAARRRDTARE
ncbi:MAG TPA: AbrB/MazE/SpoVT family DNA-binding domain-containing protein [Acetobacteraceae bacterium]|jgi:AbrB family looped-hinge helix DNA binding protein|nr:AbrB/MazE/SpoVT family DNA-binding domain-containing protein [Acetobacteraceae bacterium]